MFMLPHCQSSINQKSFHSFNPYQLHPLTTFFSSLLLSQLQQLNEKFEKSRLRFRIWKQHGDKKLLEMTIENKNTVVIIITPWRRRLTMWAIENTKIREIILWYWDEDFVINLIHQTRKCWRGATVSLKELQINELLCWN